MDDTTTETRIGQWRAAILRSPAVESSDADELEGHLREQISELEAAGLSGEEAFLIAIKRLGEVDRITAEFAREHSDRLWKQLAIPRAEGQRTSILTMLGFAALTIVLVHAARLLASSPDSTAQVFGDPTARWFARDLSLFVFPVLAGYFAVIRRMPWQRTLILGAIVAALPIAVNLFPFADDSTTDAIVAIHLPIVLWFVVGVAYVGGEVWSSERRMDFVRFTGEWAIYFALIVLGGGVLTGLTVAILTPIAPDAVAEVITWLIPAGGAAAVIVAAWLVEAKKSIIENLAPVLTAIFTPLFAAMLLVAAVVYAVGGIGRDFDRDLLAVFDVLLLVVVGLVVYGISARPSTQRAGVMDVVRLIAVGAAIVLDILVLVSMLARVGEYGFTPNRVAALGLNVVLLVNLLGTAWLIGRQLAGREQPIRLERWQTGYLPVFAAWVLLMVLVLPPVFRFV